MTGISENFYTIYKITNKTNGKFYIGLHETKDLLDGYMGSGNEIKDEIYRIGEHNFFKEILYVFNNRQDMINKEGEIVNAEFVLREDTYNVVRGGTSANKNLCTNLIEESEEYNYFKNYDIDKLQSIMNYISTVINDKNIIENKKKYKKIPFSKIAKEYHELWEKCKLENNIDLLNEYNEQMEYLISICDLLKDILEYETIEYIKTNQYKESFVKKQLSNYIGIKSAKENIHSYNIKSGDLILVDDIISIVEKIYNDNNIMIKPKKSSINDFFVTKHKMIDNVKYIQIECIKP